MMSKTAAEPLVRISKREGTTFVQKVLVRAIAILLALVVDAFFIFFVTGLNPISVYGVMWNGTFMNTTRFSWAAAKIHHDERRDQAADQYLAFAADVPKAHLKGRSQCNGNAQQAGKITQRPSGRVPPLCKKCWCVPLLSCWHLLWMRSSSFLLPA